MHQCDNNQITFHPKCQIKANKQLNMKTVESCHGIELECGRFEIAAAHSAALLGITNNNLTQQGC